MCLTALDNTRNEVPSSAQYLNMHLALSMWVVPMKADVVLSHQRSGKLSVWWKLQEQEKLQSAAENPNGICDNVIQIHKR